MLKKPSYEELEQRVKELEKIAFELKQMKENHLENEELYNNILEYISDGIMVLDSNFRFTHWNKAMERICQIPRKKVVGGGKSAWEIFPDLTKDGMDEIMWKAMQGEVVRQKDVPLPFNNRKSCFISQVFFPLRNTNSEICGIVGVVRDITAGKQAEETIRFNESRLKILLKLNQMTEASLQKIKDFTLEAAVKLTKSKIGYLTFMNNDETILNMHSWSKNTVEQCAISDKPLTYPMETMGLWGEAVRQRKAIITNNYSAPNPFKKGLPKGHIKIIRHMNVPFFEGNRIIIVAGLGNKENDYDASDVRQLTLLIHDMWSLIQRKQAEKEKKKIEVQLLQAQKIETIGTLVGGIAHNFNNLLMGIQGYTSLMLFETDPANSNYARLKNIEKMVKSRLKFTHQLLGYARKGIDKVKPLDLNQLVEETSETFGRTRKEFTIRRELDNDLYAIEADQGKIEQVLLNLYLNSADAMSEGGELTLTTSNTSHKNIKGKPYDPKPANYVMLSVADTGKGMDKNTMKRIFEPFFTTKDMGQGTGLGLAATYGIIRAHNGYIDVDSKMHQGTTFRIYLPASEIKLRKAVKTSEKLIKGTGTVLMIDDEEDILEVGSELLKTIGYKILTAIDGKGAVEIYKNNMDKIDIVLLDMIMPTMGGGKIFDTIKKINPNAKVLLTSGYSLDSQVAEILDRGCDGFIQKPFNLNQLSEKIREILQ
ncbi:MAG: GAF domain-containing protein [Proteobacteria bacterium]|nr:GAF domain-containing protein [Pseudomonadota bacterium]